jgi:putative endonuclease
MRQRGIEAETIAAEYLERLGFRVVARNVHAGRLGEIDLIAYEGEVLVFVEVKARSSHRFGTPEEAVTPRKRRFLVRAAQVYRAAHGLDEVPCRFDVVAIDLSVSPPVIRHYRDAFGSEEAF